jgi:transglutaminase-like putative cysteine protease
MTDAADPIPTDVPPEDCLAPTYFIDSDSPSIVRFASDACRGVEGDREKAIALYYAARDTIRYEAYKIEFSRPGLRASRPLEDGYGFCISKAALLAAAARSQAIPARLGFADVRNHLMTEKLRKALGSDILIYHGYTELWIDGRWVKATPAFDSGLCERFGVIPLEFDGRTDSVFHAFNAEGSKHMEYVRERGVFADVPYDVLEAAWQKDMVKSPNEVMESLDGDFREDAAREGAAARGS